MPTNVDDILSGRRVRGKPGRESKTAGHRQLASGESHANNAANSRADTIRVLW